MAKHLSPPPRKLSWLTRLLVFTNHVYARGGWVAIGIGSLVMWLYYTLSRPAVIDFLGIAPDLLGLVVAFLIGMAFLGLGIASLIYFTYKEGWRAVWLLRYGEVAMGKWIEEEESGQGVGPHKIVWNYFTFRAKKATRQLTSLINSLDRGKLVRNHFAFETKEGTPLQLTALVNSLDRDKLKDETEELILYDPQKTDRAMVFDAIPNAPVILLDGRFGPTPNPKAAFLLAPLLVLLLNIGFYAYHFGSSEERTLSESERYDEAFDYYMTGRDKKAKKAFQIFTELLEDKPLGDLDFADHERAFSAYLFLSERTKDKGKKQRYLQHAIKHMGLIDRVEPIDTAWQKNMATNYYGISQIALHEHFFAEAEQAARKAGELDPAAHLYIAHLPAALLFQGKHMEAQDIYLKWKDQLVIDPMETPKRQFKLGTLFLSDLEQIEGTKTSRIDVERAKALLRP